MSGKIKTIAAVIALAMMADVTMPSVQTIITAEADQVSAVETNDQQDLKIDTVSNETSDGDYLRGDVDLDGKVTQVDATIILRESLLDSTGSNSILEELITEEGKKKHPETYIEMSHRNGDVDSSDGGSKFVQTDATFILRALLESNISGESFISDSTWTRNIENIKEENDMASMNALVHIKDDNGNVNDIYPATKIENVEGLQTALNSKANTSDVTSGLAGKVDKETGKGLSTNDYTTTEKNKLAGIEAQANKTTVDSALSSSSTNPVQNKVVKEALDEQNSDLVAGLATKADASTVSSLSSQVGTNTTNIATQTARIDAIAALPSGSTSGDAELIDIRTKADGTTANNAGTAVREQINNAASDLKVVANGAFAEGAIERNVISGLEENTSIKYTNVSISSTVYGTSSIKHQYNHGSPISKVRVTGVITSDYNITVQAYFSEGQNAAESKKISCNGESVAFDLSANFNASSTTTINLYVKASSYPITYKIKNLKAYYGDTEISDPAFVINTGFCSGTLSTKTVKYEALATNKAVNSLYNGLTKDESITLAKLSDVTEDYKVTEWDTTINTTTYGTGVIKAYLSNSESISSIRFVGDFIAPKGTEISVVAGVDGTQSEVFVANEYITHVDVTLNINTTSDNTRIQIYTKGAYPLTYKLINATVYYGSTISKYQSYSIESSLSTGTTEYSEKTYKALATKEYVDAAIEGTYYNNKKWIALGDSLTSFNTLGAGNKNYVNYVSEKLGLTYVNKGVGGTGYWRGHTSNECFYQRVADFTDTNVDIITIFGSFNDLGTEDGVSGGSIIGNYNDSGTNTLCGCINKTIDDIIAKYPRAVIGIVSPTPWSTSHDYSTYETYASRLKQIAEYRNIPYLDLYHNSDLRPWDQSFRAIFYKSSDDGTHPNSEGHKRIASQFINFIKSILYAD